MQKVSMAGLTIPTEGGKGKQSGQLTRPERPSTRRAERETRARSSNSRFVPIRSRSKKGDSEQFLEVVSNCSLSHFFYPSLASRPAGRRAPRWPEARARDSACAKRRRRG